MLEEAFATIEGVRHTYSEARPRGMARVMLEFELELRHRHRGPGRAGQDQPYSLRRAARRRSTPPIIGKADYSSVPDHLRPDHVRAHGHHGHDRVHRPPHAAAHREHPRRGRRRGLRRASSATSASGSIPTPCARARLAVERRALDALRREHVERPGGFVEGSERRMGAQDRRGVPLGRGASGRWSSSWDDDAPVRLRRRRAGRGRRPRTSGPRCT